MTLPTSVDLIMLGQLTLAALLASIIGWQRHHAGRPAGMRTHALVAMSAVAFTAAGVYGFGPLGSRDPTRIAAQVVSAIGFLGAGTIFRAEDRVLGLTTAATLWFAAGLGVLIGGGLAWTAIFATFLALGVLVFEGALEGK